MKPIIPQAIVIALFISFAAISFAGVRMIYNSPHGAPANNPTKISTEFNDKGGKIDITTATVGVIVFVFGATGLILLLIKVPVRQILGYEQSADKNGGNSFNFTLLTIPKPILSDKVEKLPFLFWLFIKKRGIAVKEK